MREEFEKLVAAGKISRQQVEPLVQLAKAGYCMHRSGVWKDYRGRHLALPFPDRLPRQTGPLHGFGICRGISKAHFGGAYPGPESSGSDRSFAPPCDLPPLFQSSAITSGPDLLDLFDGGFATIALENNRSGPGGAKGGHLAQGGRSAAFRARICSAEMGLRDSRQMQIHGVARFAWEVDQETAEQGVDRGNLSKPQLRCMQ